MPPCLRMLRLESLKQENREIKKPRKKWLSWFLGRDFSGAPNKVSVHIERFTKEIAEAIGLPVHSAPEVWSSAQAERWQGKTEKLDASASAIILQSFLVRSY